MRLLWDDQVLDVAVRELPAETGKGGRAAEVTVGGQAFRLQVEAEGPGTFVARWGDRVETFHCARDGDAVHLFWRGRVYALAEDTEDSRAHRHVAGGLEAPMPGKVIAVKVASGDAVAKGDELVVIEAMKMENAVRAPRDGRVKAVAARVGEMVTPGIVLVELE